MISRIIKSLIKSISNQQIADKLHKPIIRKSKRRWVYSSFKDNIQGSDLADKQLMNKYKKGIRFLLYVIDHFSKNAWVIPSKDKIELLFIYISKSFK